jgi:exonuclease III
VKESTAVVQRTSPLCFLTYNILDGGRGREQELFEIIAAQKADVIILQEVAEHTFVTRLAARLNANYFIAESNSERTLALLTLLTIRGASDFHPSMLRHTCLQAALEYAPHQTLTVFGIHLAAPAYTLLVELYRLRELGAIFRRIAATPAEKIIIAGDFNSIAPGDAPDFSHLPFSLRLSIFLQGGYMARQVIGRMRARGFTDVYRALHPNGNGYTLPASQPNTRLDYFFVNNALHQNIHTCDVVSTPNALKHASDHLPVRMELHL